MARRPTLMVAVALSTLLHVGVVALAPRREAAPSPAPKPRPVPVAARKEAVRLLEQAMAQTPVPEVPKVAAKAPPKPTQAPRPAPRPRPTADKPPAAPPPPSPAPLVLSKVAMGGGVQVQTGSESSVLGDPSVDAATWKKPEPAPALDADAGVQAPPRKVVVVPPELIEEAKGHYPEEHRDLMRVVRVRLLLLIDETGKVVEAKVTKGDLPAFDAEAVRTAMRLRFRPATKDGVQIPYRLTWTVVFIPEGA